MGIRINKAEFDKFRELQRKKRNDCHAAFSTNLSEIPWPFRTFGLTPEHLREELRKVSPKLDQIVGIFIELPDKHPKGGRFFIDVDGVYWKDTEKNKHRFVEWLPEEPLIRQRTLPERLNERAMAGEQKKAENLRAP